ncbi:unnamed protein product [Strongylus vulgaris]|uniref:Uncharacterized protein n=1 Tax=Strongylus vulgaris TaxID=40348 RepID=A0A3P7J6G2_STRVU|nr:unnamed protein product [Strongylus vulgaris]
MVNLLYPEKSQILNLKFILLGRTTVVATRTAFLAVRSRETRVMVMWMA